MKYSVALALLVTTIGTAYTMDTKDEKKELDQAFSTFENLLKACDDYKSTHGQLSQEDQQVLAKIRAAFASMSKDMKEEYTTAKEQLAKIEKKQ